jgi:hypothetical protein
LPAIFDFQKIQGAGGTPALLSDARPMTLLQKIDIVQVSSEVIQRIPVCDQKGCENHG